MKAQAEDVSGNEVCAQSPANETELTEQSQGGDPGLAQGALPDPEDGSEPGEPESPLFSSDDEDGSSQGA